MSPNLPFPELIDNTSRSMFVSCPQKWVYGNLRNITSKEPSIHLHAGGAFASGLEHARKAFFDQGKSETESIKLGCEAVVRVWGDFEAPEDSAKSLPRLVEALMEYFFEYPLAANPIKPLMLANDPSRHAIEFTFSVTLPIKHPVTGNPLMYAGRFDMLAEYNGTLFAVDEKTASQLGTQWMMQWDLDSQFTGYCWAAQQYGYPVGGAIIRGISFLKTKFGHAQAIIYRPEWEIDRWYANLIWDIEQMIELWKRANEKRFIPMALDKSLCGQYGGCAYRKLCTSRDPEAWIESEFTARTWNPLHKGV
jgi:hypothetical protein